MFTSVFQKGSLNLTLGVGWGWGTEVGSVRWQHRKCRPGSTAVDGFWGVRCLGRQREQSTSKRHPYSHLHPEQVCWKFSGSGNESDLCRGVDLFFFPLRFSQQQPRGYNAPVNFHRPGWWSFWQCLMLADGLHNGPPCPILKIKITPVPSLSLTIISWAMGVGIFVYVLKFPSMWVEDQILLEGSLDLPRSFLLGKDNRSFWSAWHHLVV